MAVDGVGKPGSVPPAPVGEAQGTGAAGRVGVDEAFSVGAADAATLTEPAALERLQQGQITLDQYLDVRVQSAVQHLEGRLSPVETDFVKQVLRDQLTSDPVLLELLDRVTGGARTR